MFLRHTWVIDDVTACTCARLRRATRAVTQLYDDLLHPAGITSTQFTVLAALDHLGKTPISELARSLGMDRTSLTRTLRPLDEAKLIRNAPGADRRVRRLVLTAAGERKLAEARPLWKSAQTRVSAQLGKNSWSDLLDHLSAASKAAGR